MKPPQNRWGPLLEVEECAAVMATVEEIAAAVRSSPPPPTDFGAALLHWYLYSATGCERHGQYARRAVDLAIQTLAAGAQRPALFHGVAGAGWLVAHCSRLAGDSESLQFDDVDASLVHVCRRQGTGAMYDLIGGYTGIGVYFLERSASTSRRAGLTEVARAILRLAEISDSMVRWRTPPSVLPQTQLSRAPNGYYNLGVAHGAPGVVSVLAGILREGLLPELDQLLISRAISWILAQRRQDGTVPAWIGGSIEPKGSRLAWCYGELGLAASLLGVTQEIGAAESESVVRELAESASRRRDRSGVIDACLCHGAAGNGHLFNRLYQATGCSDFADAARFWLRTALRMRVAGAGIGGFVGWQGLEKRWIADPSFLTGASGIGLALLAAVSYVEPNWDRVLLPFAPCGRPFSPLVLPSGTPTAKGEP